MRALARLAVLVLAAALAACSGDGPTSPEGVDLAPSIVSVSPNPVEASVTPGNQTEVTITFVDSDGDIHRMDFREVSDTNDVLEPGSVPLDDLAGISAGAFTIDVGCNINFPTDCPRGTWTGDFVLVDAAGHESAPVRVTIMFE